MAATHPHVVAPKFLFLQHDASCPPQLAAKSLQRQNIDFQVVFSNFPNAFAKIHPTMYKGIVVLGGHNAAWEDDQYPWQKQLKSFMKLALAENVPILGICLGAQLLANIVGGDNYPADKGKEFGYFALDWTTDAENDTFSRYIRSHGLDESMPYSHGDTFALPHREWTAINGRRLDIKVLARTRTPYIAIFKVDRLSYGIQAHPECDEELNNIWISMDVDAIRNNGQNVEELRDEVHRRSAAMDKNGCLLLAKWFELCLNDDHAAVPRSKL